MALLWRTGRFLRSSSTPRPFSTQIAPRPSTGQPPSPPLPSSSRKGLPCVHRDKCDHPVQGTGEVVGPWAGPCQDNPSVLGAEWAWPGWTAVGVKGGGLGVGVSHSGSCSSGQPASSVPRALQPFVRSLKLHTAMHSSPHSAGACAWACPPADGLGFMFLLFSAAPWGSQGLTCEHWGHLKLWPPGRGQVQGTGQS